MKQSLCCILISILLFGCEKKIDIRLKDEAPQLVVEATIENGEAPRVILTHSLGYFSTLTPGMLLNSFVHGATVTMSNGSRTHQLKEYTVPIGAGLNLYYYSTDSSQLSTAFSGELDHSYSLHILAEGKDYTASTTIPRLTKRVDSVWWRPAPPQADSGKVVVLVRATDPPGYGDYIRYYTRVNSQPTYLPPVNSVFDDLFIDGTTYEVQIQPGIDRNIDTSDKNFFFRGDTVRFKVSNIDRGTFDFWRTWEFSYSSIGNPFSTPTKVLGNISNNALGYFGGYASQYRTLIIPR
jgi:hypothetical protein